MTARTRTALSTRAFADALRDLADFFERDTFDGDDLLAERNQPDQSEGVTLIVRDRDTVLAFAARTGAEVREYQNQTSATKGFGTGSDPVGGYSAAYRHAVTLTVVHIADEEES